MVLSGESVRNMNPNDYVRTFSPGLLLRGQSSNTRAHSVLFSSVLVVFVATKFVLLVRSLSRYVFATAGRRHSNKRRFRPTDRRESHRKEKKLAGCEEEAPTDGEGKWGEAERPTDRRRRDRVPRRKSESESAHEGESLLRTHWDYIALYFVPSDRRPHNHAEATVRGKINFKLEIFKR